MRGRAVAGIALLGVAAGCGGGARPRAFTVSLTSASFPPRQQVASPALLRIAVRNDDARMLPDVAVSIDSFASSDPRPGLGHPRQSIWILDRAPGGGTGGGAGGDTSTWALGPLAPGATRIFTWRVTPVRPGRYTVGYQVAPAPAGTAIAALRGGRSPSGRFTVLVSAAPADARVDPATGKVIRRAPRPGPYPGGATGAAVGG